MVWRELLQWRPNAQLAGVAIRSAGAWPSWIKAAAMTAVFALALGCGYLGFLSRMQTHLAAAERQGEQLRQELAGNAALAHQLPDTDGGAFSLGSARGNPSQEDKLSPGSARGNPSQEDVLPKLGRPASGCFDVPSSKSAAPLPEQMPNALEIPALLEAITRAAESNGLVVRGIDLLPERLLVRYGELPLQISVQGGYHDIGGFVSGLAAMARLVTLHDFDLALVAANGSSGAVRMDVRAKAYRGSAPQLYAKAPPLDRLSQPLSAAHADTLAPSGPVSSGGSEALSSTPAVSFCAPGQAGRHLGTLATQAGEIDGPGKTERFAYRAGDRRSPFEPSVLGDRVARGTAAVPVAPNLERPRQYLERYPIDSLAMVGTLSAGAVRYALVQDGPGRVHRLGVGHYLGENHGRIRQVNPFGIDLVEIVSDGAGGWVQRARTLPLPSSSIPRLQEDGQR